MQANFFYALEGGVCSGKSSVCNTIQKDYAWRIIPEFMDLISPSKKVEEPFLKPKERLDLFTSIEIKRQQQLNLPGNILFDRSILSILAFEYALIVLDQDSKLFDYQFNENIKIPHHTFLLNVSQTEREKRWFNRGNDMESLFIKEQFNLGINEFFNKVQQILPLTVLNSEIAEDQQLIVDISLKLTTLFYCKLTTPNRLPFSRSFSG